MQITADDLKTALSVAAFVVSVVSLYFTRVNWLQSNRPVVSAYIAEHASGSTAATFNLVLSNTGTRPAVRVRLHASHSEIMRLLEPQASKDRYEAIESVFLPKSEVPLLKNGEELPTSFGAFVSVSPTGPWLNYGAEVEISITYAI